MGTTSCGRLSGVVSPWLGRSQQHFRAATEMFGDATDIEVC
jgi:hypothetical protein